MSLSSGLRFMVIGCNVGPMPLIVAGALILNFSTVWSVGHKLNSKINKYSCKIQDGGCFYANFVDQQKVWVILPLN